MLFFFYMSNFPINRAIWPKNSLDTPIVKNLTVIFCRNFYFFCFYNRCGAKKSLIHHLRSLVKNGPKWENKWSEDLNTVVGKAQKPLGPQIMKCRGACFKVSNQFGRGYFLSSSSPHFPHFSKRNLMKISSHSPRIRSDTIFPNFLGHLWASVSHQGSH